MAAIQTTLLGRRRTKGPFFSKAENISSSRYYSVIEALWKLSPVDDRKSFFEIAQTLWSTVYSTDVTAREQLLSQAENDSQEQLSSKLMTVSHQRREYVTRVRISRVCDEFCYLLPTEAAQEKLWPYNEERKTPQTDINMILKALVLVDYY